MPDAPFNLRLVAYTPMGERIGVVPGALTWTFTLAHRTAYPVLTVDYAERSVRSSLLEERVEVAVEVMKRNGQWDERDNCRALRIERSWDRKGKTRVRRYTLYGLGWLLTRLYVWDQTAQDPGDGPTRPVRRATNPNTGELMVPTFNAAMARWNMAPGTGDEIWPQLPIEKTYQLDNDSADVEWTESIAGPVERDISEKLWESAQLCLDLGIGEFSWKKRKFEAWNFGTYGQDLSQGDAPVVIRDAGVTSAPESSTDEGLAARVKVIGEGGRTFVRENEDADLSYGALELVTSASGITTNEGMNKAARVLIKQGEGKAEQITREFTVTDQGFWPLRDFMPGDTPLVQRDNADGGPRFPPLECSEISVTWRRGKRITGHAKFGDRHEDVLARAIRNLARFAAGVTPGVGGRPGDPTIDTRYPQAPTGVDVVVTQYLDPGTGKTRGRQDVTWLPVTLAVAAEDEPAGAINLRGYAVGEKRFGGVYAEIARVGKNETSWWRDDQRPAPMKLAVAAISAQGFLSAWSEDADGAVVDTDDRDRGVGLIVDGTFRQSLRNAARAAASPGLTFSADGAATVAKMTSTAQVLKTGVLTSASDQSGRFRVYAGDRILVRFRAMRSGFSAATVRGQALMDYDDGTTATIGAVTAVLGTSYATYEGVVPVPKNGYMEVRVQPITMTA